MRKEFASRIMPWIGAKVSNEFQHCLDQWIGKVDRNLLMQLEPCSCNLKWWPPTCRAKASERIDEVDKQPDGLDRRLQARGRELGAPGDEASTAMLSGRAVHPRQCGRYKRRMCCGHRARRNKQCVDGCDTDGFMEQPT